MRRDQYLVAGNAQSQSVPPMSLRKFPGRPRKQPLLVSGNRTGAVARPGSIPILRRLSSGGGPAPDGRTNHGVVKEAPRREGGDRDDGGGWYRGRHRAAAAASRAQETQASEQRRRQQRRRTTEAEPRAWGRAREWEARGRSRGPRRRARSRTKSSGALGAAREAGETR